MCCCLLCFVYVCFVMCGGFCCFVCFVCVCLFPPPFGFHRALAYGSLNKFARRLNLPPRALMYIFVNLLRGESVRNTLVLEINNLSYMRKPTRTWHVARRDQETGWSRQGRGIWDEKGEDLDSISCSIFRKYPNAYSLFSKKETKCQNLDSSSYLSIPQKDTFEFSSFPE